MHLSITIYSLQLEIVSEICFRRGEKGGFSFNK